MNREVLKRVFRFTKPYRRYLWGAVISAVVSIAMTLLAPVLVGRGIDMMVGKNQVDFGGILTLLCYLAVTILIGAAFQWILGCLLYTSAMMLQMPACEQPVMMQSPCSER